MKFAIIGNSHLSTIKSGWEEIKSDYPNFDPTFFGSAGRTLQSLELRGKTLVSELPGVKRMFKRTSGLDQIKLEQYEGFLLVGLCASDYARFSHDKISQAVFDANLTDQVRNGPVGHIADLIAQVSNKPLYYSPSPLPLNYKPFKIKRHFPYEKFIERIVDTHFKTLNVDVIPQPKSTRHNDAYTKYEFGKFDEETGKLKRGADKTRPDIQHMNANYGALIIKELMERLG